MEKKMKAWMHWDWDNDCPFIDDDGNGEAMVVYADPEIAEEHRARTVTIIIHDEDGTEPDEEIYKLDSSEESKNPREGISAPIPGTDTPPV